MSYKKTKFISFFAFIVFVLFMFLIFRNYILKQEYVGIKTNIINTQQYIIKSIDFLINEKKQLYLKQSNIIFSDDEIIAALKNRDRQAFYNIIKKYFDRTKKRDDDFWGLHIILPDNMSFIRVHKPDVSDKMIIKGTKPLIDKVNETQQAVTSFDSGKFGYFLRVVTPIFSKTRQYLGVAEFSVSVDSLTGYIKNKFGYESLFLVKNIHKKPFLNSLPATQDGLTIFKSTSKNLADTYRLKDKKNTYSDELNINLINDDTKINSTVELILSDTAALVVAFDVTSILKEHQIFNKELTFLITFVIFVFLIIWFYATRYYLKNKKNVDSQLQKFHDMISKNVIYLNTDLEGIITEVSDAFCQISGYTSEQLIGSSHKMIRHPDMKSSIYEDLWKTIEADKNWEGTLKNKRRDGGFYWVDVMISPRFGKNHKKTGYTFIKHDITDKKLIEELSITDALTGLYNRRHFDDVFDKKLRQSKRTNDLVCFLIMDVDCFKQYNDTYGHQMGDNVLKTIAVSLQNTFKRAEDNCFRLGGEEFGMLFNIEHEEDALEMANKVRSQIENLKIHHTGNIASDYVTASFGLVCKKANDIKDTDEVYKDADDLLYLAKHTGRNKVMVN